MVEYLKSPMGPITLDIVVFARLFYQLEDLKNNKEQLALFLTSADEQEREIASLILQRSKSECTKCQQLERILLGLYDEIKHGDDEHKRWLKEKIDSYLRVNGVQSV